MSAKNLYDYSVHGAKYYLILGVIALVLGLIVLFTAPWSLKKTMDFHHIIPVVLISIFYLFTLFIFFYNWWSMRLGIGKSGMYVRYHGLVQWKDVRSFGVSKRRDSQHGLFGVWPTKWLVVNLKEGVKLSPDPGDAFLIGPEFMLSKNMDDVINVLQEYHKKHL